MSRKTQYQGQVLAIVLVILFVGVIIALALLARTMSDERQTKEERSSADALQVADTMLNAVKAVDFDELITWLKDPVENVGDTNYCADPATGGYDFSNDGCLLVGMEGFKAFTDRFDLNSFYSSVSETVLDECGYTEESQVGEGLTMTLKEFGPDDALEIDKDSVFAFVYGATHTSACSVDLSAIPIQPDQTAGVIYTAIYANTVGGVLNDYKPYAFDDIQGMCLTSSCQSGDLGWIGWNGLTQPAGELQTYSIPNLKGGYYLYEIRVRPVGADIFLYRDGDCPKEELLWAQTSVNCEGSDRSLHFVLSGEEWAPALFDYVLFNGEGTLRYSGQQ